MPIQQRSTPALALSLALLAGCAPAPLAPLGQQSDPAALPTSVTALQGTTATQASEANAGLEALDGIADQGAGLNQVAAFVGGSSLAQVAAYRVAGLGFRVSDLAASYTGPFGQAAIDGSATASLTASTTATASWGPATDPFSRTRTIWTDASGGRSLTELVVRGDGTVVTSDFQGVPTTIGALPVPFSGLSLPSGDAVADRPVTYFVRGGYRDYKGNYHSSSAYGYEWLVTDPTAGSRVDAWIEALQVTRSSGTFDEYDVATNYQSIGSQWLPLEHIHDSLNAATQDRYHLDRDYDPTSATWTTTGTWFHAADGLTVTVTGSWNPQTLLRTRDMTLTHDGHLVAIQQAFAADGSGTGSLLLDGTQLATLSWTGPGLGVMTLESGERVQFRVK